MPLACMAALLPSETVRFLLLSRETCRHVTYGETVLGLILGALLIQYANWSWVFWFVAIVASLIAWFGTIMIPGGFMPTTPSEPGKPRWKALDIGGVSILTGKSANFDGLQLKG